MLGVSGKRAPPENREETIMTAILETAPVSALHAAALNLAEIEPAEMSVDDVLALLRPADDEYQVVVTDESTVMGRISGTIGTYAGPVPAAGKVGTTTASDVKWFAENMRSGSMRKHSSKNGIDTYVGGRVGTAFFTINDDRSIDYTDSRGDVRQATISELRKAVTGFTTAKGVRTPNLYLYDSE